MTKPGKYLHAKIKANTIIEVLIAMSIMTFCSALAVIIYLNVQKSSLPFFKLKAVEVAQQCLRETLERNDFKENTSKAEEFTIKRLIEPVEILPDCIVIRILVFDVNKRKVFELESLKCQGN